MVSILVESDSRVRETACFMRLKRPDFGVSGGAESCVPRESVAGVAEGLFLPPKNCIMEGSRFEFRAFGRSHATRIGRLSRL